MTPVANPFYAARRQAGGTPARNDRSDAPRYARLPQAPRTASPVPELTSLWHDPDPGRWGDRRYPGNCSGGLIRALLAFYRPGLVHDPMTGSGTCADVCRELAIPCLTGDIHAGFDACDPDQAGAAEVFDLVWAHPP